MDINETFVHYPINQGGTTFSVVGHSGEQCVLGPTLEIRSQANGHTLGFNSLHMTPDGLRSLGEYLINEANKFEKMISQGTASPHPLALIPTVLDAGRTPNE